MANTDKQNFRYDGERWKRAVNKTQEMRNAGYDVDMTKLLRPVVDQFVDEDVAATAARLGLTPAGEPVPAYRKPFARAEVAGK